MDTRLLARASQGFAEVLGRVRGAQAELPTPCAGWSVRALVEHVIAENYAFGSAVTGTRPDQRNAATLAAYQESAGFLLTGFADVADGAPPVAVDGLPGERPPSELYEMQLADTVIHTWDLATAIGTPLSPDPEVLDVALRRMRQLPEQARGDGRPFGAAVAPGRPAETDPLEALLRLAGRDPNHPIHP